MHHIIHATHCEFPFSFIIHLLFTSLIYTALSVTEQNQVFWSVNEQLCSLQHGPSSHSTITQSATSSLKGVRLQTSVATVSEVKLSHPKPVVSDSVLYLGMVKSRPSVV